MTLEEILNDMYALEDEMRAYERKYGVLSETFYQAYSRGEEPADEAWVRDWTASGPVGTNSGFGDANSTSR